MTGAYLRIKRDGKYQAIEIDQMTDEELTNFFEEHPYEALKWIHFLVGWIRENN